MGDLRDWSPESNGDLLEEMPLPSPSSSVSSNQNLIGSEQWQRAEEATQGIISRVQPTVVSEERRKAVIGYVQRLIRNYLGCEVYPFGSVPLKTYLPDGDIDLTAFGAFNMEEALAHDVCSVLAREDQNRNAEFVVKDAQVIRAEVKLVKCLVQNIIVDISFNQLGGLCTLCFLEQVDRLIGKDHLFKRSIILIKAWCYYESRILGAHHGLISTYALETLVLYIFNLFHSSLNGPLVVLYKFLDYFSKFDWDNYCISLNGPVRLSSLPEFVVESHENGEGDVLLSNEFLKDCVEQYSVPPKGFEANLRTFPPKHLNIIDPLKENNNLGRSVSKGNFYRIRSAFTYGVRKLGRILSLPGESIASELQKFFSNTLDRHGSGERPDVQDPSPMPWNSELGAASSMQRTGSGQTDQIICDSESTNSNGMENSGFDIDKLSGILNEPHSSANGISVSENRLTGDAKDLATSKFQRLVIATDVRQFSSGEEIPSFTGKHCAPHVHLKPSMIGNGIADFKKPVSSNSVEKKLSGIPPALTKDTSMVVLDDQDPNHLGVNHDDQSLHLASPSGEYHLNDPGNHASPRPNGNPERLNSLSDLNGDYESHINSLHHGRWWYDHALNMSYSPTSPQLLSQFQNKNSWDVIQRSLQLRRPVIPQINANGVIPRSIIYPMNPQVLPGAGFGIEDMPKPRGTGTYFPNTTHYRDRPLTPRGRNQGALRSPRSNGRVITSPDSNFPERSSRDFVPVQLHVHQGAGKDGVSDLGHPGSPEKKAQPSANGSVHPVDKGTDCGSVGNPQNTGSDPVGKPVIGTDQERIALQSYHMNEEDFPPLSI